MAFAVAAGIAWIRYQRLASDRAAAPEFPAGATWINSDRPLRLHDDLKGQVVLLDFWTQGCINCQHVIPDLARLEATYADEPFVIIGVHSAKFSGERDADGVRRATERLGIRHPVVVDQSMRIWNAYDVDAWPTFVLIGADGRIAPIGSRFGTPLFRASGEGHYEALDAAVARALREARRAHTLAPRRVSIESSTHVRGLDLLAFPGKVATAPAKAGQPAYVFISDSAHHRIIITARDEHADPMSTIDVRWIIGDGVAGFVDADEPGEVARFRNPQGLAFDTNTRQLYVADVGNDAVRIIDINRLEGAGNREATTGVVRTLVRFGEAEATNRAGAAVRDRSAASWSPWDVALAPDDDALYVALAGQHEIWRVEVTGGAARKIAGHGEEEWRDGMALEAAFAQPSGVAVSPDGGTIFVADAESSGIRRIDLAAARVETLVGHGLFDYGNASSDLYRSRLQHPLGVAVSHDHPDVLFVADTYNNAIKRVDLAARRVSEVHAFAQADNKPPLTLDHPGGVHVTSHASGEQLLIADTNHHRIVSLDPLTGAWHEFVIRGLGDDRTDRLDDDVLKRAIPLKPGTPAILSLTGALPESDTLNPDSAVHVEVRLVDGDNEPGELIAEHSFRNESFPISIEVPAPHVREGARWRVRMEYVTCKHGDRGVCTPRVATWVIDVTPGAASEAALKATEPIRTKPRQ